jgi:methyl-accepting chemotaxis protein
MFAKMKTGAKILTGFGIAIVIAVIVGAVGYYGIFSMKSQVSEIVDNRLPSIQSLLIISEAQTAVNASENALLSKSLDAAGRQQRLDRIKGAWN